MKLYTKGSAHVIIVSILVVALIGALGFIFWQNFIVKKDSSNTSSTSNSQTAHTETETEKSVASKTLSMTDVFSNGLSLNYPENWNVVHEPVQGTNPPTDDSSTIDAYTFTSPDNSIRLKLSQASGGGIGGVCVPEEETSLLLYGYEASNVWMGHTYAEWSFQDSGGDIVYVQQALTSDEPARSIKAGDSRCKVMMLNYLQTDRTAVGANPINLISTVSPASDPGAALAFTDAAAAKSYLSSQNAKDVKSILLSIH